MTETATYGELRRTTTRLAVKAEPHVVIRLKRTFSKIHTEAKGWLTLSDTLENCREMVWFIERYPLAMDAATKRHIKSRARKHREEETLLHRLMSGIQAPREFQLAIPPRDYQRSAAELCLRTGGLLCADDLGVGKTVTGICVLSFAPTGPGLVVTMPHLQRQWQSELARFAPDMKTHILKSSTPYDVRATRKNRKPQKSEPFPDVLITTYSKLSGWAGTLSGFIRRIVFDEAQELRRTKSEKWKAAKQIADAAEVRLGLSGSPIYNYGDEIHNVLDVLRPGALGTREEWLREWCKTPDSRGRAGINDPAAFGTYVRANGLMIRRTRRDVGRELPPFQKVTVHVEADAASLAEAEDAASELARLILAKDTSFFERGRAANELDWRLRQATGIAKAPYVAEFVRMLLETGEPVLLFGYHHAVYDIWRERLKDYRPVFYTGEESVSEKERSIAAIAQGHIRLLIMSIRSGVGIDGLQHVIRTTVHGELDWSPQVHNQGDGRVFRDGQKDPVVAYYPISTEGSDPAIADVIGLKASQSEGILNPDAPLALERDPNIEQRAKRLAQAYLDRKETGRKEPR